jgi:hypothetical protein
LITLKDGKQRKHEFYFGSTYLSNSSRGVKIPAGARDIKVFGVDGKSRQVSAEQ